MILILIIGTSNAYAVCTEFNKSGCDTDNINVCQEEWGIYSDRYRDCVRRREAETERLEYEARNPSIAAENQPVVVAGNGNIVTVVHQKSVKKS